MIMMAKSLYKLVTDSEKKECDDFKQNESAAIEDHPVDTNEKKQQRDIVAEHIQRQNLQRQQKSSVNTHTKELERGI